MRTTVYVVRSFTRAEDGGLIEGEPIQCGSSSTARIQAQLLAPSKAGVVAFQRTGDAILGDYDPALVLFAAGSVPELD